MKTTWIMTSLLCLHLLRTQINTSLDLHPQLLLYKLSELLMESLSTIRVVLLHVSSLDENLPVHSLTTTSRIVSPPFVVLS